MKQLVTLIITANTPLAVDRMHAIYNEQLENTPKQLINLLVGI